MKDGTDIRRERAGCSAGIRFLLYDGNDVPDYTVSYPRR
jgi:hypothetical protein